MSESTAFELSANSHTPAPRNKNQRVLLRNAIARKSIEQRRERQRLREHIQEVWNQPDSRH